MEASNIFHLRQRRRARRSAEDLHSQLEANTRVRSFSQQAVLKRVKRELLPREVAGAGEEKCFVSTLETASSPSRRCVFPFQYRGVLYQRCTSDHSSNGEQWCATSVARDGEVVRGEWGDCDFSNVECRVLPPPPSPDTAKPKPDGALKQQPRGPPPPPLPPPRPPPGPPPPL